MTHLYDLPRKPATLVAPRRNNYYFGKLMDVLHFQLEQRYGDDKRQILNRLALGEGVLCGLTLEKDNGRICVNSGVALDKLGREIIVPAKICIDPWTLTDECGRPAGILAKNEKHIVHLCVMYRECASDFAPVFVADCNMKEESAAGTIIESFRVLVREGLPEPRVPANLCDALLGMSDPAAATAGYEVVATIDVGGKPVAVAVSHDGRRALVANDTGPALHVIDVDSYDVIPLTDPKLQAPIGGVSVAPDGGPALVSHANGITIVDLASGNPKIVRTISGKKYGACAAAAAGSVLYAIDADTKKVDRIDVAASAAGSALVTTTINDIDGAVDLAVSPDNKWLYVLDVNRKELLRADCSTNDVFMCTSVDAESTTLAIRERIRIEVYAATKNKVRRSIEDGIAVNDYPINAEPLDSAFSIDGRHYFLATTGPTTNEIIIYLTEAGAWEVGRLAVGNGPTRIAAAPDMCRFVVANAGSGTISIIEIPPFARHKRLCEVLTAQCTELPACPCVVLGTVELLPDGATGTIDSCSHRSVVYSNAMLLELILCLADRLDECCRGGGIVPLPPDIEQQPTLRVEAVQFLADDQLVGELTGVDAAPRLPGQANVNTIRIVFTKPVKISTVTTVRDASDNPAKATFLVRMETRAIFGTISLEAGTNNVVRFKTREPDRFEYGEFRVDLFGSFDIEGPRRPITDDMGNALDGEPVALPSGDGLESGDFTFKFEIQQ